LINVSSVVRWAILAISIILDPFAVVLLAAACCPNERKASPFPLDAELRKDICDLADHERPTGMRHTALYDFCTRIIEPICRSFIESHGGRLWSFVTNRRQERA
jgi:hypothetical protein